jgi:hypothetical protein
MPADWSGSIFKRWMLNDGNRQNGSLSEEANRCHWRYGPFTQPFEQFWLR